MFKTAVGLLILLITSLINPVLAQEKLVFSVAPTQSVFDTRELFTPLVKYLSGVTGREIALKASNSYQSYVSRMRNERYDILLDGSHLTSWRMKRKQHVPLVRFPGTVQIVVVMGKESGISRLEDLGHGRGVRVCTFDSPNIQTMSLLNHFPNPLQQPTIKRVKDESELEKCLRQGPGRVAVFKRELWERMDQTGLKVLFSSKESYPEMTLSAGPRVDQKSRDLIRKALLSSEGQLAVIAVLDHYRKEKFIAANAKNYQGLDQLLIGVWGFE